MTEPSPDLRRRIEAGAMAAWEANRQEFSDRFPDREPLPVWNADTEALRAFWRRMMAAALPAAYPEFLTSPPGSDADMTPADLSRRIEAAATWIRNSDGPMPTRSEYRHHAESILRVAFPELFTDPPQAWLAPLPPKDEDTGA